MDCFQSIISLYNFCCCNTLGVHIKVEHYCDDIDTFKRLVRNDPRRTNYSDVTLELIYPQYLYALKRYKNAHLALDAILSKEIEMNMV